MGSAPQLLCAKGRCGEDDLISTPRLADSLLYRILDDVGGAFGMGAVGGGLWHLLKGMKNSPSGHRMIGGIDVSLAGKAGLP